MLSLRSFSSAILGFSALFFTFSFSSAQAMEGVNNIKENLLVRTLPLFEEFDEDGQFFRYSNTLEDSLAIEIDKKTESESLLKQVLEEIYVVKNKQKYLRSWPLDLLNEYMGIVKLHEEGLARYGINIYDIPYAYVSRTFREK